MKNNDPETIAKAIEEIINNETLYKTLKERARTEIIENFSVSAFATSYYKAYENLIR
jgi:glycosyltransferase involved in cell wall biosynthesis